MIADVGAALVSIVLAGLAALWTWRGRRPRDRGVFLSDDWRATQRARE